MKKRTVTFVLATCMLMGTLSGCGENKDQPDDSKVQTQVESEAKSSSADEVKETGVKKEGYPIVDETMNLSVLAGNVDVVTKAEDCDIYNEIAEVTNVDIEWEIVPNGTWADKKGLILARTELPDIIIPQKWGISDDEYLNMVNAGQLVAIDEYLDYAPNFCKVLENSPGLKESITASDGHIYAFPYFIGTGETYACMTNQVTYIDQKWLDALNMEIPKTTEDLKNVLVAFKENDLNGNGIADEIPLTTVAGYFDDWFGAFGIVPSANELGVENLTLLDGKVVYAAATDEYRAALDYFHELWTLGVIDPEAFTQDSSMVSAKEKADPRVAGMFEAWRGTAWRLSDDDVEYAILPALTGPNGDCLYPQRYTGLNSRAGALITTDCENVELAMRWIDTLIDPKYSLQMHSDWREGYHYEDNGGEHVEQLEKYDGNDPVQNALVDLRFICVDWTTDAKQVQSTDPLNVNNEKSVSDAIYKPSYPKEHYPNVFLTLEEASAVAEINADLVLYMDQFYADWIVNGGDDAAWEKHLKQLENLGVNKWVEVYTGAYDRYNAS